MTDRRDRHKYPTLTPPQPRPGEEPTPADYRAAFKKAALAARVGLVERGYAFRAPKQPTEAA